MKYPYSFVILRYVHDIMTGEQLNVGVVVFSENGKYLGAQCRPTFVRLSHAFPGLRSDFLKSSSRYIQNQIREINESLWRDQFLAKRNVVQIVTSVLPKDESAFQWSEPGLGVSSDLPRTLKDLYGRLITRYDEPATHNRKSDDDVWRHFRKDLEKRRVLKFLKSKVISATNDEFKFRHAWKNGAWHCLEPVSFDLSRNDGIRDKAHRILGQLTGIKDAREKFRVYLLVGKPRAESMMETYEKALRILENASRDVEIVTEKEASQFVDKLAKEIAAHENIDLL
jgi:hypothetical protein